MNRSRERLSFPRHPAALLLAGALCIAQSDARADDLDLFNSYVAPNVMLVFDTSGSMNTIVYHPAYRSDFVYDTTTCPYIADPSDPSYDPKCLQYPLCAISGATTISDSDSDVDWNSNETSLRVKKNHTATACGRSRTIAYDPDVEAKDDWTSWPEHYLEWYFSQNTEVDHDGDGQSIAAEIQATANGVRSQCLVDAGFAATYASHRRARISAAREVIRDVTCASNQTASFRYGLARFETDSDDNPEGGYVVVPPADFSLSHVTAINTALTGFEGDGRTPLAETLYNVYRFFQSRTSSLTAEGKDTSKRFPVYDLDTSGDTSGTVPGHPVTADCQQHFVILITDGVPVDDDFSDMDPGKFRNDLIGDYNLPGDEDEEPPNVALAPDLDGNSCGGNGSATEDSCRVGLYLDDVAAFMADPARDFMREAGFDGIQTVGTFTVGFSTSPVANALLQKTADAGGGEAYFTSDADELGRAVANALASIQRRVQSFASASVPASRTVHGDNFYATTFTPRTDTALWEGHLKAYDYSPAGDILTPGGNCAIGADPTATAPCPTGGILRPDATPFWDAAAAMPDPDQRKLFYGAGATAVNTRPPTWTAANVAAADLGLVAADLGAAPYDAASDLEDLADKIVKSTQGCEFGTDCTIRSNALGERHILGDVFHSNPLIVGSPNARINEPTYRSFAVAKRGRSRVIYAGANDGFLHGFHAGAWESVDAGGNPIIPPRFSRGSGVELMGFMPSAVREDIVELGRSPGASRDYYAVDGSPAAADVWLYRDFAGGGALTPLDTVDDRTPDEWRTVMVGGLRQGGRSYYALDVTNPDDTSNYPGYLWEFPCDDCTNAVNPGSAGWSTYLGETWSEPVIARVRVRADTASDPRGYERWVAIFGAGYDESGDPNHASYDWTAAGPSEPRGRAIFMVDVTTGEVLAVKHWSASAESVAGTQKGFPEMRYAFASAPAVFDIDFDGYADVVYIGDLGGNVWKWVIRPLGDDPVNNVTNDNIAQPSWPFRIVFRGAASTEPPAHHAATPSDPAGTHFQSFFFPPTATLKKGKLILALGAGERANPTKWENDASDANNNHFYVFRDVDPFERATFPPDPITDHLDESDLATSSEVNSLDCASLQASKLGFTLTGRDAEKFTTNAVIFLGELITGSFVPADPNGANACSAAGQAFLYRFDVTCGTGSYPSNPGTDDDKRRRAIGTGLPSRPRMSVGGLNGGGGGGGCENRVVMVTSDGAIENDCANPLPSLGTQLRSWRKD